MTEKMLSRLNIEKLNEMQDTFLKESHKKQDIILLSKTGTGKTIAFLLAILKRLKKEEKGTQAMIVVPSRELALQIEQVFKTMSTGFKITATYGGHKREIEENNLKEAPAVIVGTPGRIGDHIRRENITVDTIKTLVLDEFDKSLELGFLEEMKFVIGSLKHVTKKILTSATGNITLPDFLDLEHPQRLDFLQPGTTPERVDIKKIISHKANKEETLFRLLCHIGNRSLIVFCNQRETVEMLSTFLSEKRIYNEYYHGKMEQQQRESALSKFRNGTCNVLITTDLASRGLDIENIRYIIHYQIPETREIFIHRNGRTGRMDASGTVVFILNEEEYLPEYIDSEVEELQVSEECVIPEKPKWTTLFIAAGKKDKINKGDIAGFLMNKGQLKKEDVGLIDVKDFYSFAAIRRNKMSHALNLIKGEKIKNKKVKMEIAR